MPPLGDKNLLAPKYLNAPYLSASRWSHQTVEITMNLLKLRTRTSDFDVLSENKCNGLCFENCGSIEEQTITQPLLALKGCAHCKFYFLPQIQNKARVLVIFLELRKRQKLFFLFQSVKRCVLEKVRCPHLQQCPLRWGTRKPPHSLASQVTSRSV